MAGAPCFPSAVNWPGAGQERGRSASLSTSTCRGPFLLSLSLGQLPLGRGAAVGVKEVRPAGLARPWDRTIERANSGHIPLEKTLLALNHPGLPGQVACRQGQGQSKASRWHQSRAGGNRKGELGPNLGEPVAKTRSEEGVMACFLRTVAAQKIWALLSAL